jgi:hypothetical protein
MRQGFACPAFAAAYGFSGVLVWAQNSIFTNPFLNF